MKHDQNGDLNGQQLYRLLKLYDVPNFVKAATSTDIYGTGDLAPHQYADRIRQEFPCHTAAATYVSNLFFLDKQAEMPKTRVDFIKNRLVDFAILHGITNSIETLNEKIATATYVQPLSELSDDYFAVVDTDALSGEKLRNYPLRNALEVKRAAEWLQGTGNHIPFRIRTKIASKILDMADRYGAGLGNLDQYLYKQAGRGACPSSSVIAVLKERAELLKYAKKPEVAGVLDEMIATISKNPQSSCQSDRLVDLAAIIDDIDKSANLQALSTNLLDPTELFFEMTEKLASQLRVDHISTTSGNIYKRADLEKLKVDDICCVMGKAFSNAVTIADGAFLDMDKLAEIIPTLPRGDAELLDRLMATYGVKPVAKQAAYASQGVTYQELEELAAQQSV